MKDPEVTVCVTSHGPLLMAVWRDAHPFVDGHFFPEAERFLRHFCRMRSVDWIGAFSEGVGEIGGQSAVYAWALVAPRYAASLRGVPERAATHNTFVLAELLSRGQRPTNAEVWALWEETLPHDFRGVERRGYACDDARSYTGGRHVTEINERAGRPWVCVRSEDPSTMTAAPWWCTQSASA